MENNIDETTNPDLSMGFLTLPEAAKFLGMGNTKLRSLVKDKQIAHYRPAKVIKFKKTDLLEWLESQRIESAN